MFFFSPSYGICSMQRIIDPWTSSDTVMLQWLFSNRGHKDHILMCNKVLGFREGGSGDSQNFGMWMFLFICL